MELNKKERLLLINQFCDKFETNLRNDNAAEFGLIIEAAESRSDDPEFLDSLLTELIALTIAYSDDREAEAALLKSKYPHQSFQIDTAINQCSLSGTVFGHENGTKIDASQSRSRPSVHYPEVGKRFVDLRHFASGGLGDVFIGFDKSVQREVAIKLLKPELIGNSEAKARFLLESDITGGLEHPGIVPIYDAGITEDGQPYYAMRFLKGQTLKDAIASLHSDQSSSEFVERQRLLIRRLVDICDAISYSHDKGVIHRDLKPANILLGDYGESVVIDWGLARRDDYRAEETQAIKPSGFSSKTRQPTQANTKIGSVLGTPEYMSPEQASGDPSLVGKASDVYSLGANLYCILTGVSPSGRNEKITQARVEQARISDYLSTRERMSSVPAGLDAICSRAMQFEPEQRYQSPRDFAHDLNNWLSDMPIVARPDTMIDRAARLLRKYQRIVAIAACALIAVTIATTLAALIIDGQRKQLAIRKTEADELAKEKTVLAAKEVESARAAIEASTNNRDYAKFMSDFFDNLDADKNGADAKLSDALDDLSAALAANEDLAPEPRRNVLSNIASGYTSVRKDLQALEATRKYAKLSLDLHEPQSVGLIDAQGALVRSLAYTGKVAEGLATADETLAVIRSTKFPGESLERIGEIERDIMRHRLSCLQTLNRSDELKAGWEELYPWLLNLNLDSLPTEQHEMHIASQYIDLLREMGADEQALEWQKKLYEAQKNLPSAEKKTMLLGSLFRLSQAVNQAQGHSAALPYRRELVESAIDVLGPKHSNTLVARANLTDSLYFLGQYEEARTRFTNLQKCWQENGDLRKLLIVETKLARVDLRLGQSEKALELLESIKQRIDDSEDIEQTSATANIANFYLSIAQIENGKYQDAVDTIEDEIDTLLSSGMPDKAAAPDMHGLLQFAFFLQGDFESAIEQRKYFSDEVSHLTIVESAQTAESLFEFGRPDEAQVLMEKILAIDLSTLESSVQNNSSNEKARTKCIQSNIKGLLAEIIAESDPKRSEKLLLEAVSELCDGYTVLMRRTRVEMPLNRHGKRLVQFLESTGELEKAESWRKKLGKNKESSRLER